MVFNRSRFAEGETFIKFRQAIDRFNDEFSSSFVYPTQNSYPKNFNTKINKKDKVKNRETVCVITGKPAKYKDPLT